MTNKTNESHMTNLSNKTGGYQSLIVYQLAVEIYDLTAIFCERFINRRSRTFDQMIQAARSGKQNITEGSLANSTESNLKLTSVARASFGELLEDYRDYLRQHNLPVWPKDDARVMAIRSHRTNWINWYESYLTNGESFANLMVTLCFKEGYLLDQLLKALKEKFIKEGGFRENLFKERLAYKTNLTNRSNRSH